MGEPAPSESARMSGIRSIPSAPEPDENGEFPLDVRTTRDRRKDAKGKPMIRAEWSDDGDICLAFDGLVFRIKIRELARHGFADCFDENGNQVVPEEV